MTDHTTTTAPVPGPRTPDLPPPPQRVREVPADGDLGGQITQGYWETFEGEASRTALVTIARRLPAIVMQVWGTAWRADARAAVLVAVLQLASAAMASAGLIASLGVLQKVFAGGATGQRIRAALPALAVVAALLMLRGLVDAGISHWQARLGPRVRQQLEADFLALTSRVELAAVDDPTWADEVRRANDRGLYYAKNSIDKTIELASAALALLGAAGVLGILHPVLLVLLLAAVVPKGAASVHSIRAGYLSAVRQSTLRRRMLHFSWVLYERNTAAELRASNVQQALLDEHRTLSAKITDEEVALGEHQSRAALLGRALGGLGMFATYAALAWMLGAGWMPLATGGAAYLAIQASQSALLRLVIAGHQVFEHALWVEDLKRFEDSCRARLPRTGAPAPAAVQKIEVRDVRFTYPQGTQALRGVSLTLRAGRKYAFVGANGSGKSTLSRILAGLYEPTGGTVHWDGADVREFDAASLTGRVALVLQDPGHWPLPALANITIGSGTLTTADPERVLRAVRATGADRVIAGLDRQWHTVLSPQFEGGAELSDGNWSKIACARGLYQQAPVLVMDEPTASMDPLAEDQLFRAVLDEYAGSDTITVLVSHRLGPAVACDRVFVFDQGRIVEAGSHQELIALGGTYAEMFETQAAAYRTSTRPGPAISAARDGKSDM
ncbi:ATP-binding cassette domain-containing protein [Kitasatospora sp. NPDC088783]|uniref:ATP-binding cassette domain-containing protein n=1 Tax=Kitasatospora sp. NPDC088783 TaxID=3364077 RepID=UPI003808B83B